MTGPVPAGADPAGVLILGGGLAGLFAALKLSPLPVTVVTAAPLGDGASSAWAQGGIAAAVGEGDTVEAHVADTVRAGAGLVDEAIALGMAREARARVEDLLGYGVPFDRDLAGRLVQSREAAHSARRVVRVKGDTAGAAIMAAIVRAVRAAPSIRVLEGFTGEAIMLHGGRVAGLVAGDAAGRRIALATRRLILATGGLGHLFAVTTNPPQATGQGVALAAGAGARLVDLEFVQFHPTAVDVGRDPAPLASEALRGEGAVLVTRDGERFMPALHPDADLAPRDIVARGVAAMLAAGRGAYLDGRAAIGARFPESFPTITAACRDAGIDPVTMPIPVAPAAHYAMGGVAVDARGRTDVPGLWAAGEVAGTGAHGANRLASNSLLEAVVFAARIAEDLAGSEAGGPLAALDPPGPGPAASAQDQAQIQELRHMMSRHLGVLRTPEGMAAAGLLARRLETTLAAPPLRLAARSARLLATAALWREESRGAHQRTDFPATNPAWAKRRAFTLAEADTALPALEAKARRTRQVA